MNIPIIILARGGSKRLPGKNIKEIAGRPMIYWVLDACYGFQTYVATDSAEIADCVLNYSQWIEIIGREPVPDGQTSADGILSIACKIKLTGAFITMQATSPLVRSVDVQNAVKLYESGRFDSVVSGVAEQRRRWMPDALYCEQNKYPVYTVNGAIFVSSMDTLRKHRDIAGGKCGFSPMPLATYFDIDTPEEFAIVERLLHN